MFFLRVQRGKGRRRRKTTRVKAKQWLKARELFKLGTNNLISPYGEKRKSERKFISKLTRIHVRKWSGLVHKSVLREFAPRNNLLKVQRQRYHKLKVKHFPFFYS